MTLVTLTEIPGVIALKDKETNCHQQAQAKLPPLQTTSSCLTKPSQSQGKLTEVSTHVLTTRLMFLEVLAMFMEDGGLKNAPFAVLAESI